MKYAITHIIMPITMLGMTCATSCTSDYEPMLESGEELKFEVVEAESRASVTTNSNLTNRPFSLFGDMNRTGKYFPGLKVIFNGDKVTYKNNKWDYGAPMYWLMGQEHSFVALHPSTDNIPGLSDLTYSDSKVSFTYTLPRVNDIIEYSKVADILVATHRRKYNYDTAGAVKFGFRHMLSRINIAPALDEVLMYEDETDKLNHPENQDEYISFHKIEIFGLKTKASFSFTPASLQTEMMTDESVTTYQVDNNSAADAVLTFSTPKIVTNNKNNVNICDDNDAMLVLPQEIGENAKVILYYTVNDDNPMRTITFSFSDLPIDKWETCKTYTYMFTIEKAYTGQIKPGSLKWKLTDITDNAANDRWINENGTIRQEFDLWP